MNANGLRIADQSKDSREESVTARLIAPIQGRIVHRQGHVVTPFGHDLDFPAWQGAEIGFMDGDTEAQEAIAEVARRGWPFGIHYPLVKRHEWDWAPFWFDPAGPETAVAQACSALEAASRFEASYILFHFPWPALLDEETDYRAAGWKVPPVAQHALAPRTHLGSLGRRLGYARRRWAAHADPGHPRG